MLVGRFQGRDIIDEPTCPFCGSQLERPGANPQGEMPMGLCACGAVFACDVTGHNLGTALSEALVAACGGDWDAAWDLLPEEDYQERQVHHYDPETHLIIHGGVHQGRRIAGTLLFIRLQKQAPPPQKPEAPSPPVSALPKGRKSFSKKEVEALVAAYKLEPLVAAAEGDRRILRDLKRLLYSADPLLLRRAAEALGKVSAVIARSDPGPVTRLLQGLFSSVTDTAASSWGAIDAIGEVMASRPELCPQFLPQLIRLSRIPSFLESVLRALGRISESSADLHQDLGHRMLLPLLSHPAPGVRGAAAAILGNMKAVAARPTLRTLCDDLAEVDIYRNGVLEKTTVGRLAMEALGKV
ncbi:MAG: DVU0298 family protein [Thermodesulfobacteriota bacterium]